MTTSKETCKKFTFSEITLIVCVYFCYFQNVCVNANVIRNIETTYRNSSTLNDDSNLDANNSITHGPFPYLVWKRYEDLSKSDDYVSSIIGKPTKTIRFLYPNSASDGNRLHFILSSIDWDSNRTSELVLETQEVPRGVSADRWFISSPGQEIRVRHTDEGYNADVSQSVNYAVTNNSDEISFDLDVEISNFSATLIITETNSFLPITRRKRSSNQVAHMFGTPITTTASLPSQTTTTVQPSVICGLLPWTVHFEELGWNFVYHPSEYEANKCLGVCPTPLSNSYLNSTNYAFIKNQYHFVTNYMDYDVPRACCVPLEYSSLSLLLIKNGHILVQQRGEMTVRRCGCR